MREVISLVSLGLVIVVASSCSKDTAERRPTREQLRKAPVRKACEALFRQAIRCKDEHWAAERIGMRQRGLSDEQIESNLASFERALEQPATTVCQDALEAAIRPAVECYTDDCTTFVLCLAGQRFGPPRPIGAETAPPGSFLSRPASFSLLAFRGDVRPQLAELLIAIGYEIKGQTEVNASAWELNERVMLAGGGAEMAFWFADGFTIVLDPEMVLAVDERLESFCAKNNTSMIAAIWERVSQSVLLEDVSADGSRKSSYFVEGKVPAGSPPASHPALAAQPDSEGLGAILVGAGLRPDRALGDVTATVLTLGSSK